MRWGVVVGSGRWSQRWPLPLEMRRELKTRRRLGESTKVLCDEFGVSRQTVSRIMNDVTVELVEVCRGRGRLSVDDREVISRGLVEGLSQAEIGRRVGCSPSTISREVVRNGGVREYRAVAAERATCERAKRPKQFKFAGNIDLADVVTCWLERSWSPTQISARLRVEFPDDEAMRVSAETIYRAIYVHGRGGLRAELQKYLRSQRPARQPRPGTARETGSKIIAMVSIHDRPEEVAGRLVPGHWEGDLIVGARNGSQIATLVERTTGYVQLVALADRKAATLAKALAVSVLTLPEQSMLSLTWDQGVEMADHVLFKIATDVDVYFCDPHAPWQRGSNENTNGLLRQYFPKGTDLSVHSQERLDEVARELNGRPRARHEFRTPLEMWNEKIVALTA